MNDSSSPASATLAYATILGGVRLVSAQCYVFKLWYSRRAYERSRGEMITMLYEKTLNRKILGAKQPKSPGHMPTSTATESDGEAPRPTTGGVEHQQKPEDVRTRIVCLFKRTWSYVRAMFSKKSESEKVVEDASASAGKILNLMR